MTDCKGGRETSPPLHFRVITRFGGLGKLRGVSYTCPTLNRVNGAVDVTLKGLRSVGRALGATGQWGRWVPVTLTREVSGSCGKSHRSRGGGRRDGRRWGGRAGRTGVEPVAWVWSGVLEGRVLDRV